jgi:hypothetical protein
MLRSKLKEFLDLEQGNHSVFNYTRQFNTLAQCGTYPIDTDEKKVNLYHARLTIHLQERLVHHSSLSYNELASAAIDQERMMKAVEADEKKIKRIMPGSTDSGSSSGAPPKYRMVYNPPGVSCVDHNSSRIGAIAHNSNRGNSSNNSCNSSSNSNSSTMLLPHRHSRLQSGHHSRLPTITFRASTVGS